MFTFFVLFLLYLIHFGIVNKARLVMKRASIGGMVKGSGQLFLCVCVCVCVCVFGGGGGGEWKSVHARSRKNDVYELGMYLCLNIVIDK